MNFVYNQKRCTLLRHELCYNQKRCTLLRHELCLQSEALYIVTS